MQIASIALIILLNVPHVQQILEPLSMEHVLLVLNYIVYNVTLIILIVHHVNLIMGHMSEHVKLASVEIV